MAYLLKDKTKKELNCDFLALAKKEPNARMRIRLLCLELIHEGKSYRHVSAQFKLAVSTVQDYVNKFREGGIEALKEKPKSGRRSRFPKEKEEKLKQLILDTQKKMVGGRLIGKDIQKMINDEFEVKLCLASIYVLLKRIGLTWVSSRSQHPKKKQNCKMISKNISWTTL